MSHGHASEQEAERRGNSLRPKVLLAATVQVDGSSLNVRVRNISLTGALLESDASPQVGSKIAIARGDEYVQAEVVWSRKTCFGVRFSDLIDVSAWTGTPVQDLKPAAPLFGVGPVQGCSAELDAVLLSRVGEELAFVQRLIGNIGDELVGSPLVVQRYGSTLQGIDLASQLLGHLARVLMAEDRPGTASQISLECLRKRLLR